MMTNLRRHAALLLAIFILSSCGYKMAGVDEKANYKLYISEVHNLTSEPDLEKDIEDVAVSFFSTRNALGSKKRHNYNVEIRLKDLEFESKILTETGQSGTTAVTGLLELKVIDVTGKEIYKNNLKARTVYDLTGSISKNKRFRTEAIQYVIRQALTDFYHEFRP